MMYLAAIRAAASLVLPIEASSPESDTAEPIFNETGFAVSALVLPRETVAKATAARSAIGRSRPRGAKSAMDLILISPYRVPGSPSIRHVAEPLGGQTSFLWN